MARGSLSCRMGACYRLFSLVSGDSSDGMGPRIRGVLHHAPDFGAGESVAYPCYSKILASDFPQHHRGLANWIIDAASKMGPALGTLLGGVLMARLGWRWFFIGLGIGSLVWLIPWIIYMPRDRAAETVSKPKGPSLTELLSSVGIGLVRRPFLWKLLLVFPADLAPELSGAGTQIFDGSHGRSRLGRIRCDRDRNDHRGLVV